MSGYAQVNVGLKDPDKEGMRIMAIGDLNNDKLNDLVTANKDGSKVTAWYFDESSYSYSTSASFALPTGLKADSVIVTKSQDPKVRLQHLLVTASTSDPSATQQTKLLMFEQMISAATQQYSWAEMEDSDIHGTVIYPNSQPMILDANADQA